MQLHVGTCSLYFIFLTGVDIIVITTKCFVLLKIERIQNLNLWRMYAAKRHLMESQNPKGTQNERELWHGTPEAAVISINLYGFNRSYCRDNSRT